MQHPNSLSGTPGLSTPGDALWEFSGYTAVPEPSRALLALGGLGAMFFRRRRA